MGDLPESRITPLRPFTVCGTDFGGPFLVREGRGWGHRTIKSYLCVFVCFSTKAVYLELVGSLSTDLFLESLKRFIVRRGLCREINSDNGTNFVGANREIKRWYDLQSDDRHNNEVAVFLSNQSIQWRFSPARSPHFRGLWEAVVKSVKRHLYKITTNSSFPFEELSTMICQIEVILNSRPLLPLSSNPTDFQFLTPGHFLVGDSLMALPKPTYTDVKQSRLNRFQLIQQMQHRFWKLWSQDYLVLLQARSKWQRQGNTSVTPGILVLLLEPQAPPLSWRKGRIVEVHPGVDGIVRVVSIQTTTGIVNRSITKIVKLLDDDDHQ